MTYTSIDICRLKSSQKILLCNAALDDLRFSNEDFLFETPPKRSKFLICTREEVTLTSLEADNFETNQFSMIACYSEYRLKNMYYLGKNHLPNSATIYKRTGLLENHYYPHTLIFKIDLYKLIQDTRSHSSVHGHHQQLILH